MQIGPNKRRLPVKCPKRSVTMTGRENEEDGKERGGERKRERPRLSYAIFVLLARVNGVFV
jgi:hypothetical protein